MSRVLVASAAVVLLAPIIVTGQAGRTPASTAVAWTPASRVDGQPDLQGMWTNATITPFERPSELAGKEFLTEKEAADLEARTAEMPSIVLREKATRGRKPVLVRSRDEGRRNETNVARRGSSGWQSAVETGSRGEKRLRPRA